MYVIFTLGRAQDSVERELADSSYGTSAQNFEHSCARMGIQGIYRFL